MLTPNLIDNLLQRLTTRTVFLSRLGIGVKRPTASVHIQAGKITPEMAPLKLDPGTLMTYPENGAFEYDGTHLYFTIGTTRTLIV